MTQVLDSLPSAFTDRILCCYVNVAGKMQVARITNVTGWYFERVVFPGQRLIFEAPLDSVLEIHSGMMASAILSDRIPCLRLQVQEVLSKQASRFNHLQDQQIEQANDGALDPILLPVLTQIN